MDYKIVKRTKWHTLEGNPTERHRVVVFEYGVTRLEWAIYKQVEYLEHTKHYKGLGITKTYPFRVQTILWCKVMSYERALKKFRECKKDMLIRLDKRKVD